MRSEISSDLDRRLTTFLRKWSIAASLLLLLTVTHGALGPLEGPQVFKGASDASAAVAIGSSFFITASDEDAGLRIYSKQKPGLPVSTFTLVPHLPLRGRSFELDLEGGCLIGHRVYWIGSHARTKNGERRRNREHFFAVDVDPASLESPSPILKFVGHANGNFLESIFNSKPGRDHALREASNNESKSREGLNIEGLCASKEGGLWIGFRSPTPQKKALLIHLDNPNEVLLGGEAILGRSIVLDLDGLGIRDLVSDQDRIYLVAGSHGTKDKSRIYRWKPSEVSAKHLKLSGLKDVNPEAITIVQNEVPRKLHLFTDSGRGSDEPFISTEREFHWYEVLVLP